MRLEVQSTFFFVIPLKYLVVHGSNVPPSLSRCVRLLPCVYQSITDKFSFDAYCSFTFEALWWSQTPLLNSHHVCELRPWLRRIEWKPKHSIPSINLMASPNTYTQCQRTSHTHMLIEMYIEHKYKNTYSEAFVLAEQFEQCETKNTIAQIITFGPDNEKSKFMPFILYGWSASLQMWTLHIEAVGWNESRA